MLYKITGITVPEMAAILDIEGTDTVVEFYVTYGDGSDLALNQEQVMVYWGVGKVFPIFEFSSDFPKVYVKVCKYALLSSKFWKLEILSMKM